MSTSPEAMKQLRAVAVNELENDIFISDVILVSPSYLIERDERELKLMEQIEEKKIK